MWIAIPVQNLTSEISIHLEFQVVNVDGGEMKGFQLFSHLQLKINLYSFIARAKSNIDHIQITLLPKDHDYY